jgi:hypothetical protein
MSAPFCRHIKTTGHQCGSPALRGHRYCYYHTRSHDRHSNFRPNPRLDPFFEPGRHIRLVALEDRASLLMAISQTVNAVATGQIEIQSARTILYGLNLASLSLRDQEPCPETGPVVHTAITTPDHLDLAPPEPAFPTREGEIQLEPLTEPTSQLTSIPYEETEEQITDAELEAAIQPGLINDLKEQLSPEEVASCLDKLRSTLRASRKAEAELRS